MTRHPMLMEMETRAGGAAPPQLPPVSRPFARPGDGADPMLSKPQAPEQPADPAPLPSAAAVERKVQRLRRIVTRYPRRMIARDVAEFQAQLRTWQVAQAAERDAAAPVAAEQPARVRQPLCFEVWMDEHGKTWMEYLAPDPRAGQGPRRA